MTNNDANSSDEALWVATFSPHETNTDVQAALMTNDRFSIDPALLSATDGQSEHDIDDLFAPFLAQPETTLTAPKRKRSLHPVKREKVKRVRDTGACVRCRMYHESVRLPSFMKILTK